MKNDDEKTDSPHPFGYCPKCGAEVWSKEKWLADGKKHVGCLGSTLARVTDERDRMLPVFKAAFEFIYLDNASKVDQWHALYKALREVTGLDHPSPV